MNRIAIIWIIIGLVLIAALATFAFNRQEAANEPNPEVETATTTDNALERGAVRAQAATELTMLRARAEAGETYEELADDFAQIRARVAASYENAEASAEAEWQEIRADFDSFEASARASTSNLLDSFTDLIDGLSADIRVESTVE